ncbi:MAG: hypothetical protein KatS3mg107_0922 [Gemmataceae bacterium]|jgi:hypothetical protein|nr:MAG: hypothetical protein KatS3mg107_0922 [Gemmataceae bacterium]
MIKQKLLATVLVMLVLSPLISFQGVSVHVEYVEDIDNWRVEVFAGAANADGFFQGPLREAGIGRGTWSMCFFPDGQVFLALDGVVMTITKDGVLRFFAGTPGLTGYQDGLAAQALLGRQISICPDGRGGLYVGDRSNRCLRRITQKGKQWIVETVAGDPNKPASEDQLKLVREEGTLPPVEKSDLTDGQGKAARFSYLHSNVIADADGNAYLMDSNFPRRITPDGRVETLNPKGGTGVPSPEKNEPLISAKFRLIMGGGMCFGGDGNIYVADRWNHCIRKVDLKEKTVSVVVGPGTGYVDGPEKKCGFHDSPGFIVYDPYRKRFYVAGVDDWGLRTWENGFLKTIAGGNIKNKGFEGAAKETSLHWARVIAVDPRPPHDIYFRSGGPFWDGRIGRLYRPADHVKQGAKP